MKSLKSLIDQFGEPDILIDSCNATYKRYAIWGFSEILQLKDSGLYLDDILINQNIASRLYQDTSEVHYLSTMHEFYDSVIVNHKHEFGYVHGIDAYSKEIVELGNIQNQRSPSLITNKLVLSLIPSANVNIIWTIIGTHELSEPFITGFHDSGRFNNIEFDYNNRLIDMKTVYGEGTITFADQIESVLVDGVKYENFNNYTLETLDGKHRYQIYLASYDDLFMP